jgi:hypothetical protein
MINIPWSIKERNLMVELWQAGESAAVIAFKLGNGRTRNSVLGHLHRLRRNQPSLDLRFEGPVKKSSTRSIPVVKKPRVKAEPKPQINLFTPIEEVPAPEGGVPYFETRLLQCKYILNTSKDPSNIKCCGATVYRNTSWCRNHYAEVFTERTAPGKPADHLSSGKIQVASKFQFRRM